MLSAYTIETQLKRYFTKLTGLRMVVMEKVRDFRNTYWRVRYPEGSWEELNRQAVSRGGLKEQLQLEHGVQCKSSGESIQPCKRTVITKNYDGKRNRRPYPKSCVNVGLTGKGGSSISHVTFR